MKKIAIVILLACLSQGASAQLFDEWFRQKKTRLKYLAEQIAALKVYGSYLKKGYDISKKGLTVIGDLKDGDMAQHRLYFSSLKDVNPQISKYPAREAIISMQQAIQKVISKAKGSATSSGVFTDDELHYIAKVFEKVNADCQGTLKQLSDVTTAGKVEMKDDERLTYIDTLYVETKSQYSFVKGFSNSLSLMAVEKKKQHLELKNARTWYGIKED